MERVKGIKLLWAILLALAVFLPAPLGVVETVIGQKMTVWGRYILPWLRPCFVALAIMAVSIITGILFKPQRPERLTVFLALIGSFCVFAMPIIWSKLNNQSLAMYTQVELRNSIFRVNIELIRLVFPLAAACWAGTKYWRAGTWGALMKGSGGALIKGVAIAAIISIPLSFADDYYRHTYILPQYYVELAKSGVQHIPHPVLRPIYISALFGLHGGAFAAIVVALLASWRPKPLLGAFAGSGLLLGVLSLNEILYILPTQAQRQMGMPASPYFFDWMSFLTMVILGAIAGIYAGRWTEEGIDKQAERSGID